MNLVVDEEVAELRRIVSGGLLFPVFQPILDFRVRAILGYESLIRGPENSRLHWPVELFAAAARHGMTQDLESLQPNEMVMCRLMISDSANPNVYERTYRLPMTMASAGTGQVTAQLGVDFLMRTQAVRLRYNPFTSPGLF